jgi:uncharacterized repeat protein (TIGR01451 family)
LELTVIREKQMARKHNFRLPRNNRAFAAVALAGPLVALLPQLSPFLPTAAGPAAARPTAAMHLTSAQPPARVRSAAGPGKRPASPHPSQSAPVPPSPTAAASGSAGGGGAGGSGAAGGSASGGGGAGHGGSAARAPELSIGVSDGRQHVQPGDLVTYAVKIHNIGKRNVPHLRIVQTLPAGMKLISATRHPATHAGQLTWKLGLAAGHTGKFRVVGRVGPTPGQLLRLATIACAEIGTSTRPVVCAAHSDELPAGAVAAAHASHAAAAESQLGFLQPLGAALALAGVAGACWLVFRRSRRRGRRAS